MDGKTKRKRILIADTTLRDGEQAPGCRLKPAAKLEIARQLRRLGVDVIEAGFPASSPVELATVRTVAETVGRGADAPEIGGLARCVPSDIEACWQAVKPARRPRIHVFLGASDIHLRHKLRMTRREALRRVAEGVGRARSFTKNVQFSAEDASRADRDYLAEMLETAIAAGASTVNVPDTVGYAMPEEFADLVRYLRKNVRNVERARVAAHCHDDLGLAVANSLAALRAGAGQVECTVNGIGERAGNCALEEIVMALRTRPDFYGARSAVDAREIRRTSRMVARLSGMAVQANKAVVGANAFAHASGIHQDGMLKHRSTYEIMRPEDVGWESSALVLTARSGRRALAHRLKQLGRTIGEGEMEGFFRKFKALAERRARVSDGELLAL